MRKWWKHSLALSFGLVAGAARAADPVPAVQLERPVIATAGPRTTAVSLERPVPIAASQSAAPAVFDPALRPTTYTSAPDELPPPVFRGQAPDGSGARPMPPGPTDPAASGTAGTPAPTLTVWRRSQDGPQVIGNSSGPAPMTVTGTVVASAGPAGATGPAAQAVPAPTIAGPVWSLFHPGSDDGCGAGTADGCGDCECTFGNRFYASADYLLWWIKGSNTPPLVTRGSAGDPIPGALGLPGTTVLFGGGSVEDNPFSGGRFNVGYWFGDQHLLGIEAGGFFLGQQGRNFSATSFGNPILTRPIVDATTGMESTELVAGPGVLAGTVSVNTESKMFGYESNLRSNLCAGQVCGVDYFVDGILGFRGLGLDETLDVHESLVVIGGNAAGEQFSIGDHFGVQNRFYGGQLGALSEFRWGRWVLDLNTKLALGPTQEMVNISGSTVITPRGGTPQAFNGGLLALSSNIGRYDRDVFTWVPELGLNIGYQWTEHLRFYVGYNVLYWSSVVRPGEQIDRAVNPNLLPPATGGGPARPQFAYNASDFWVQGVTLGLEFKY
jgi:hypothetical protein